MLPRSSLDLALVLGVIVSVSPGCGPKPAGSDTDSASTSTTGVTDPSATGPTTGPTTSSGATSGGALPGPIETEWEVVIAGLPFPLSGPGAIGTLTVGRKEFNENFANRGLVEVLFDHPEETITVEMRRYAFTFADDPAMTLARLSLYAFVKDGTPAPPGERDPADDCAKDTWKDDCAIYAYYDGQSQPAHTGIDLRVHLPRGYRGRLFAETEDNAEEQTYPRRGDVTIRDLCGSGDVALEAGRVNIKLCPELTPTPTCDAAGITACDEWVDPDTMMPAPWSKDCPCGSGELFGQLYIRAPQPWAANITVDIPPAVWLNAVLQNISTMKPHDCKPAIDACTQQLIPCTMNAEDEYSPTAEFNYPGPSAPQGAGYNVTAIAGGCTAVPFVDSPEDWNPDGEPNEELRGLVTLCTGCL